MHIKIVQCQVSISSLDKKTLMCVCVFLNERALARHNYFTPLFDHMLHT